MRTPSHAARAHGTIDDLSRRVLPMMIDKLSKRSHAIVERTAIGASDAAEVLLRGRTNLSIVRRAAVGRSRDFVRDYPLSALAIAAIAGAAVFGIWRSHRD